LTTRALGSNLGEENHALSSGENASHRHSLPGGDVGPIGVQGGATYYAVQSNGANNSTNTGSTGSGTPHNNMQPTVFLNTMIKL